MNKIFGFALRVLHLLLKAGFLAAVVFPAPSYPTAIKAESDSMPEHWRGSAVLGNGRVCAGYSDDPRTVSEIARTGIQHFYYGDYTADYVHSTAFELRGPDGRTEDSGLSRGGDPPGRPSTDSRGTGRWPVRVLRVLRAPCSVLGKERWR